MITTGTMIISAVILIVLGLAVGALITFLVMDRQRKQEDDKNLSKTVQPLTPAGDEPQTGLPAGRFESVAHLYREKSSGRLVTEVSKRVFLTFESVPVEQRADLKKAAESWCNWMGVPASFSVAPPPQPFKAEIAAPKPAFTLDPTTATTTNEKPRATSMVGQINAVLQEMLANTPYADKNIFLAQDSPMGGVVVWIGTSRYNGVEMVPDPTIQSLIREAVRRWEKESDPGAMRYS